MKYPKKSKTIFVQFDECDCRQVNVHRGRKFLYWFIEPYKKPFKTNIGEIPFLLCGKNINEKLEGFHLF
jgi:hypothetical protein